MSEFNHRRGGPIPLALEAVDRRWLRDEANALGVKSSDVAAYLIRAARLSTLPAMDAGKYLAAAPKLEAVEADDTPTQRNPLLDAFDEALDARAAEQAAPYDDAAALARSTKAWEDYDGAETKAALRVADIPARDPDGYVEDEDAWEAPPPRQTIPATPKPFIGKHGARPDIVQLHELGSLTRPAGMRDEYMRDFQQPGDARGNLIRQNMAHLRKGA